MQFLQAEEMATIEGGLNFAGFVCGFGIILMIAQPESALVIGEGTVAACASA